jgi:hypothetical protein
VFSGEFVPHHFKLKGCSVGTVFAQQSDHLTEGMNTPFAGARDLDLSAHRGPEKHWIRPSVDHELVQGHARIKRHQIAGAHGQQGRSQLASQHLDLFRTGDRNRHTASLKRRP